MWNVVIREADVLMRPLSVVRDVNEIALEISFRKSKKIMNNERSFKFYFLF